MKKLVKVLFLVFAVNAFTNSHSNACGWLWNCQPTVTYQSELLKVANSFYKSGVNLASLTAKDVKNLAINKVVPTIANNNYLLTTSIGLVFLYTMCLSKYTKSTIKKTLQYGFSPIWIPAYYAWRELRQARKIERLQKRIVETNQVNRGNIPIN